MGILESTQMKLATSYASVTGNDESIAAIDPALIAALLDIAVQLIKTCLAQRNGGATPAAMIEKAKTGGILARFAIRRAARNSGISPSIAVDAMLHAGANSTPDEIVQLANATE